MLVPTRQLKMMASLVSMIIVMRGTANRLPPNEVTPFRKPASIQTILTYRNVNIPA